MMYHISGQPRGAQRGARWLAHLHDQRSRQVEADDPAEVPGHGLVSKGVQVQAHLWGRSRGEDGERGKG